MVVLAEVALLADQLHHSLEEGIRDLESHCETEEQTTRCSLGRLSNFLEEMVRQGMKLKPVPILNARTLAQLPA